jgi:hypothetical protein
MTNQRENTHRLYEDGALCGAQAAALSPCDSAVDCPTCLALIELAQRRRRSLVRRSVVVIGKLGSA